jgi:long-chain acyl-CoA synthetase
MRIEERLRESAVRHGPQPIVIAGRARHGYAELDLKSERLGTELGEHGVGAGDRVLSFLDDGWEAVVSAFAVFKAGAVLVPVAAAATTTALIERVQATQPVAVVTQSRLGEMAAAAIAPVHSVKLVVLCGGDRNRAGGTCISFEAAVERIRRTPPLPPVGSETDAAVLIDGEPPLSHGQLLEDADALGSDGRALPPLAERAGLVRLLAAVSAGHAMIAPLSFARVGMGGRITEGSSPAMAPRRLAGLFDGVAAGATPAYQR